MANITRRTKRYPYDLTNKVWERIAPPILPANQRGRKRATDFREVINALRYFVRSGCGWEMLPVYFSPWQTIYWWSHRLIRRFLFRTICDVCLLLDKDSLENNDLIMARRNFRRAPSAVRIRPFQARRVPAP